MYVEWYSQKERDFVNSNYNDMVKRILYMICFNMEQNCMNHFTLTASYIGWELSVAKKDDLLNLILVGLNKDFQLH